MKRQESLARLVEITGKKPAELLSLREVWEFIDALANHQSFTLCIEETVFQCHSGSAKNVYVPKGTLRAKTF